MGLRKLAVPKVEAYGRYLDLDKDGEHLSFIVFTVPSFGKRFGTKLLSTFRNPYDDFLKYMGKFAGFLGSGVREMHDHGKCHLQLHFDNFYYNPKWPGECKLYVTDWSTSQPLSPFDHKSRALDIRIPWQGFKTAQNSLFQGEKGERSRDVEYTFWISSMLFTGQMLSHYFKRDVDFLKIYNELAPKGIKDELTLTVEAMRILLHQS